MIPSFKEQIENRCIHFNGIQNEACKIGVKYHDIRGIEKPYKFPCLNKSKNCDKCQFPTPEEVLKEIIEWDNHIKNL